MKRFLSCSIGLLLLTATAPAADLRVYYDVPDDHPTVPNAEAIAAGYVNPSAMIRFDVDGSSRGYRHRNLSRDTIRSIRLKITDERDRFTTVDGGDLFPFVEIRDGGREVVFAGANVPSREYIWLRFPVRARSDGSRIYYLGEALTEDLTPNEFSANYFASDANHMSDVWKSFWLACPSIYRNADAVAASDDQSVICVLRRGIPLVYTHSSRTVSEVQLNTDLQGGRVNRITFDPKSHCFRLWRNWNELGVIDPVAFEAAASYSAYSSISKNGSTPAEEIPLLKFPEVNRCYFTKLKVFNLRDKTFTRVFFDAPKALSVFSTATALGADDNFYILPSEDVGQRISMGFFCRTVGQLRRPFDLVTTQRGQGLASH